MYRKLCIKTALSDSSVAYSEVIDLREYNTVQIDTTVFTGTVTVSIEQTDNSQDWTLRDTYASLTGPAYKLFDAKSIQCARVRVKWQESTGSGTAVIAAGINCSKQ